MELNKLFPCDNEVKESVGAIKMSILEIVTSVELESDTETS